LNLIIDGLWRIAVIKLSYSTFGLTNLDFLDAINVVDKAGYAGIELSFHRTQFNPFEITDEYMETIKKRLAAGRVKPACVATASHFFMPSRPHEPSLMSTDLAGRKRRIDLIKRGIEVARKLGVRLVTFGSGFIREEHVINPAVNPRELLVDSIHQCIREIRDGEDITLLIEPEPGMFIETMEQGISLIDEINSARFKLHVDICHAYCSEKNYIAALGRATPYTRYLHISDAREGYNLKIVTMSEDLIVDLDFASTLIYFPEYADYLLVDRNHPVYFCDEKPNQEQKKRLEAILEKAGMESSLEYVDYSTLFKGKTSYDDEIFTYLISVPRLSFDVLERAHPIIAYLRGVNATNKPLMEKMVANTLTGVVHFHEIPGEGTLDFASSFKALRDNGFSGYGSVELYHHVLSWENALTNSFQYLSQFVDSD
jgi:sugar phosphate isomerase/epimerase